MESKANELPSGADIEAPNVVTTQVYFTQNSLKCECSELAAPLIFAVVFLNILH